MRYLFVGFCILETINAFICSQYFHTDRSKGVLLLWFLTVTCSCCTYLYFGSPIMWVTYLGSWMTTCLGKSCSFGLPRVPFVDWCRFMYLVISLLGLRAGYGIWLYQFLIIVYLFTIIAYTPKSKFNPEPSAPRNSFPKCRNTRDE